MAKRQSLHRLATEADELVSSAKRMARLRELLKSEAWAEVDECIKVSSIARRQPTPRT